MQISIKFHCALSVCCSSLARSLHLLLRDSRSPKLNFLIAQTAATPYHRAKIIEFHHHHRNYTQCEQQQQHRGESESFNDD
jgi:hypothetical protein